MNKIKNIFVIIIIMIFSINYAYAKKEIINSIIINIDNTIITQSSFYKNFNILNKSFKNNLLFLKKEKIFNILQISIANEINISVKKSDVLKEIKKYRNLHTCHLNKNIKFQIRKNIIFNKLYTKKFCFSENKKKEKNNFLRSIIGQNTILSRYQFGSIFFSMKKKQKNYLKKKILIYMLIKKLNNNNFNNLYYHYSANKNLYKDISSKLKKSDVIPILLIKYISFIPLHNLYYPIYTKNGFYITKLFNRTINNKIDYINIYNYEYFYKRKELFNKKKIIMIPFAKLILMKNIFYRKYWRPNYNHISYYYNSEEKLSFFKIVKKYSHLRSYDELLLLSNNIIYNNKLQKNINLWKKELYNKHIINIY